MSAFDDVNNKEDVDAGYLKYVISNFNSAINNNLDVVHMGYYIEDGSLQMFDVYKTDWIKLADLINDWCIKLEEYELCSELKQIKEILNGHN